MAGKTKIKCPECGSLRIWSVGTVPTRSGPKKRYKCYECARSFYAPEPKRKRAPRKAKKAAKKS